VAVVHQLSRRLEVSDGATGQLVRAPVGLAQPPRCVAFLDSADLAGGSSGGGNKGSASGGSAGGGNGSAHLLAVAEHGTVTLWDLRASRALVAQSSAQDVLQKGATAAAAQPLAPSARAQPTHRGLVHCVAGFGDLVACAGDDRMVFVLDPRASLKVTSPACARRRLFVMVVVVVVVVVVAAVGDSGGKTRGLGAPRASVAVFARSCVLF
jgi:hypothetical protein